MKKNCFFVSALCLILCALPSFAQDITDLNILRQGGYILFFRHASAPGGNFIQGGTGTDISGSLDSQWWKSCDPATARQLSTTGRVEAMTIGNVMRRQNYRVGRLISSEYCRAYESAVLMNMNTTIQLSSAASMVVYPDAERVLGLRDIVNQAPVAGTNTVVWTHGTSQGEFDFIVGWSDAVVYRYNSTNATASRVGVIRYPTWAQATTGTSVANAATTQASDLSVSVSPNPSAEQILLQAGKKCDISIVNVLGQEVYSEADVQGTRNLNVSAWAAGTYIITAGTATKRVSTKFVKF
ncbi:MAG: T9SS C-terminal target domain-containing protein [Candidatus Kapaibacterium sp.]|nr:MAG: T9SS C-terminal target domain-containing protein [Candidatus Kapabacteria bacterium]